MSVQETVLGHLASSSVLMASMSSKPRSVLLAAAYFSLPGASIRIDASHPYRESSIKLSHARARVHLN